MRAILTVLLVLSAEQGTSFAQTSEPPAVPVPAPPNPPTPPHAQPGSTPESVASPIPQQAPPIPAPPPASKSISVQLLPLEIMREKGIITEAEYESAVRDVADSIGAQAGQSLSLVVGRWSTTLYGFVEEDNIFDSTQSFNDIAGNGAVARTGTYAGDNRRFTMSVRNSRFGFRIRAPEYHHVRASALLEMDFLGNQPPTATESQFFTNPTFRFRHYMLKIETPIVDIMMGQYWDLFGWQSIYQPNSVQIQGVPGEVYSRTPQVRVSKTVKSRPVTFEAAIAMMRPPQRNSWTPEGQAGLRLAFNQLTGLQTSGATGTSVMPASIAVTGDLRRFALAQFSAAPQKNVVATGWGVAVDAYVPLIPHRFLDEAGNLAIHGEYVNGRAIEDLYTSLTLGVTFPALPNPTMANPAPTYTPDVDPGMVTYDAMGGIHTLQLQTFMVGAQYYFPGLGGRMWLAGNFSRTSSDNAHFYGKVAAVRKDEEFGDVNLFGDVLPSLRLGLEYAHYADTYADNQTAVNHRIQLSAFYLF